MNSNTVYYIVNHLNRVAIEVNERTEKISLNT